MSEPKTAAQHNSQLTGDVKFVDGELNPNHPVTRVVHDHWHKVAAMLMWKLKQKSVTLTLADIEQASNADLCVVLHDHKDSLEVKLVTPEEARRLIRDIKEGGGLAI